MMEPISDQCVLCLLTSRDTIEIFSYQGRNMKIAETLAKHFQFLVNEINGWASRKICVECWSQVATFDLFHQSVYFTYQQRFAGNEMKWGNGMDDNNVSDTILFAEPLSEGMKDDFPDLSDISDEHKSTKWNNGESLVSNRPRPSKRKRRKTNEEQQQSNGDGENGSESMDVDEKRIADLERRIPEYFHMACDLCEFKFDSWMVAKEHYLHQHNISRAYLKCCNKKYILRGRILHHVSWHIDPNAFTCQVCSRRFNEKRALSAHLLRHTDENNRKFVCEKCDKRFTRQHKLNRHMIDVHPVGDQKFVCEFCQKNFKLEQTLKMHILKVHKRVEERICDICAKIFKSKEGFQDHMLSHGDTEEPRVQCTQCGTWLKNKGSLKKHIRAHTESPQTCTICHKVKSTRSSLRNHMQVVHSEAIYECTICKKRFRRQLTLTEHIASHTGENLYTCPYCPKMFKSNSNMHKHRKQSHRDLWTQDRQKKQSIYSNETTGKLSEASDVPTLLLL